MKTDVVEKTKSAINNLHSDPVNSLGYLIPIGVVLLSIVSAIVGFVRFIISGGYSNQVSAIKEYGLFNGYDERFTLGTAVSDSFGVIGKIVSFLLLVELVLIIINFFRFSSKTKRTVMIVDLVIIGIQTVLSTLAFVFFVWNLLISDTADGNPLEGMPTYAKVVLITYVVISLASWICFMILVLNQKESRWMVGHVIIALLISYGVTTIIVWFLENIVNIVSGIIAIIIVVVGCIFALGALKEVLFGGSRKNKGSVDEPVSNKTANINSSQIHRETGKEISREEEIQAEVRAGRAKWVDKGVKLRKVDRGAMLGKRVETYNEINECHLCYIAELESGKVRIYEKGTLREIKAQDIPWYTV